MKIDLVPKGRHTIVLTDRQLEVIVISLQDSVRSADDAEVACDEDLVRLSVDLEEFLTKVKESHVG